MSSEPPAGGPVLQRTGAEAGAGPADRPGARPVAGPAAHGPAAHGPADHAAATGPAARGHAAATGPTTGAPARPLRTRTGVRLALLLPGGVALLLGLDAGLGLLGLPQVLGPALGLTRLPDVHGPLMALGFVGTVISLERAVALGAVWGYAAPAVSGLAVLALVGPLPILVGQGLLVVAQVLLLLLYRSLLARQPTAAVTVQVLGAVAALGAAVLWAGGVPVPYLAPWLATYLVLTILGERLSSPGSRRSPRPPPGPPWAWRWRCSAGRSSPSSPRPPGSPSAA